MYFRKKTEMLKSKTLFICKSSFAMFTYFLVMTLVDFLKIKPTSGFKGILIEGNFLNFYLSIINSNIYL